MTNFEKIKGMSTQELVKFLSKIHQFDNDNCSICNELLRRKDKFPCGHSCCVEIEAEK